MNDDEQEGFMQSQSHTDGRSSAESRTKLDRDDVLGSRGAKVTLCTGTPMTSPVAWQRNRAVKFSATTKARRAA